MLATLAALFVATAAAPAAKTCTPVFRNETT